MRKTVLALIASTFLLATAGTVAFAEIILPTIDDIDTRELEPRSETLERDRHALLLSKLLDIAKECRAKGDFNDARRALLAAKKIDKDYNQGNVFERSFELAHVYGDMNRWRDAQREFDRLMLFGNSSTAAEIVKYALDHKQMDIATSYEKYLQDACEPDTLLVYSRLLSADGNKPKAIEVAKQAYGLSAAFGLDQAKAISALSELQGIKPEKLVADKSFEKQFWEKVDKLKTLEKCPTPGDARSLVDEPAQLIETVGTKRGPYPLSFRSAAIHGAISAVQLHHDNKYFGKGLTVVPNNLTCSLDKEDVLGHLKSGKVEVKASDFHIESETSERLALDDSHCVSFYIFGNEHRLLTVGFLYKTLGPKLIDEEPTKVVSTPSWSALYKDAQEALNKRNFTGCKRKLTKAFNVWTAERNAQPGDYAVRRKQYAQLKDLFIALYTAWEKPKIADYFKTAILPDIQRENDNVLFEIMSDFPTAKHQTWKVQKVSADCFDIYAGEQGLGVARRGDKLYDELVRLLAGNPEESNNAPPMVIIDAPPMVLIDDECFKENPLFR